MTATFIRLLAEEDKGAALERAILSVRTGDPDNGLVYRVEPAALREIPGSPFAYWASERVRRLFHELPPFESEGRTARVGLQTGDDFRFVRAWWEVSPEKVVAGGPEMAPDEFRKQTFEGKKWVPFAKGGSYSPYYADLHLVVNWERDGEEIKNFIDPATGRTYSRPQNTDFYFRPGLTWPRLPHRRGSFWTLQRGSIFSVGGMAIFAASGLREILGIVNSEVFLGLMALLQPRGSEGGQTLKFEAGFVASTPLPQLETGLRRDGSLASAVGSAVALRQWFDLADESTHSFQLPPVFLTGVSGAISDSLAEFARENTRIRDALATQQGEIETVVAQSYGLVDWQPVTDESTREPASAEEDDDSESEVADQEESGRLLPDSEGGLLSYTVGCGFGRWDIRLVTRERQSTPLLDPFAPLPASSAGMLTRNDGLQARDPPPGYPLDIAREGILVDDPDHPDDVVTRVRAVLDLVWGERASAIEREACELAKCERAA